MNKLLFVLLFSLAAPASAQHRVPPYREGVPTDSIRLSDPFILADSATHTYYMTGTGGLMWTSKGLQTWDGPRNVIEIDTTSWMGAHPQIWAAELHHYKGKYYYFATFTNNAITIDSVAGRRIPRRACHILVSDKPDGPYRPMKDPVYLPAFKPTLDATLWIDTDGHPYMVYCHEWLQNGDGTVEKIRLNDDLSGSFGLSQVMFRASDSPWSRNDEGTAPNAVTDGPWLFRTESDRLGCLWTSWVGKEYTMGVAYSKSGTLDGPWIQEPLPLYALDGAHSMLFRTFDGELRYVVHHSEGNGGRKPQYWTVDDSGDKLVLGKQIILTK